MFSLFRHYTLLLAIIFQATLFSGLAWAHCDTMDGPVVLDAQRAFALGDVTPVLKWVGTQDEPAIRQSFDQALRVRKSGGEAAQLAERYFFETLVRLHRAGEGEPYTGLKDGNNVSAGIRLADKALETGVSTDMIESVSNGITNEIQTRYNTALQAKKHAEDSVEAGRDFVKAYVEYIHFVEGVNGMTEAHGEEHGIAKPSGCGHSAE